MAAKTKRILYLDIETSGLSPEHGAVILSIGAVLDRKTKKDPISEFYRVIRPTEAEWRRASPQALHVNGITWEYLVTCGESFYVVREDLLLWLAENGVELGKAILVGQNPEFDMRFLRHFMGDELAFINFPFDDVYDVRDYYSILVNRRVAPHIPHRDGVSIAKALGVEPEPLPHNALAGAWAAKRNYEAIMGQLALT